MFVVVVLFFKEDPFTAISKPFTVSEGSTLYYSVTQVTDVFRFAKLAWRLLVVYHSKYAC